MVSERSDELGGGYKAALKYRETYSDLNIFNPEERKWDKNIKASGKVSPSNRSNHSACELGGVMLLYGGYWGEEKRVMSDFFVLDLHTISWH